MLNKTDIGRPESRFTLIVEELSRSNVDIASLSEVRFPEESNQQEHGAGYTLC